MFKGFEGLGYQSSFVIYIQTQFILRRLTSGKNQAKIPGGNYCSSSDHLMCIDMVNHEIDLCCFWVDRSINLCNHFKLWKNNQLKVNTFKVCERIFREKKKFPCAGESCFFEYRLRSQWKNIVRFYS